MSLKARTYACFCTILPIATKARRGRVARIRHAVGHEILRQFLDLRSCRLLEQGTPTSSERWNGIARAWSAAFCSTAMPTAPPRLRIMLNRPEAEPAFSASIPDVATAESGANTSA